MRVLLLLPERYSLSKSIEEALSLKGFDCTCIDHRQIVNKWETTINTQIFRVTDNVRQLWEQYYFKKINHWYLCQFKEVKPDLVFIYNNEMLLPDTLLWLKKNKIKTAFYLGDSPFYTPTNRYNLMILEMADAVFVPDTFWKMQLEKTGIKNVQYLLPPLPKKYYFPLDDNELGNFNVDASDIVYIGMSYKNAWGYKKTKFLSMFSGFDLKIYADSSWNKWLPYFPELKDKIITKKSYIPVEQLNVIYNAAKIIPVDGNPGIQNGIHARVSEALASQILPIMEWNKDMDDVFEGVELLPAIKCYDEIPKIAQSFLNDEHLRKRTITAMINSYEARFNVSSIGDIILNAISY